MEIVLKTQLEFVCDVHTAQELKAKVYAEGAVTTVIVQPCHLCMKATYDQIADLIKEEKDKI